MNPIPFMMNSLLACSFCGFHSQDNPNGAAAWSIFFLLVVILIVLGGVSFFLMRMIRRDRDNLDPSLCDDYVPGENP